MNRGIYSTWIKWQLDFTLAAVGLLLLFIPMAGIALLLVVFDGRPVFFRQARVGRHGNVFHVYKFRTMTVELSCGSHVTVGGDRRITKFGAWLRRWKLDELPQLLNVLAGQMSFVGPRPDVPGYMDRLQGDAASLLELRPGITGPATLAFRDEEDLLAKASDPIAYNDQVIFPEKVRLNLKYLDEMSLLTDLRYIFRTLLSR